MEVIPNKVGTSCLGPCRLSLVVPHLKTPIPKCFYHLLLVNLLTDSEFSCFALHAKPYPVSCPTPLPHIPNELHCIQTSAHEVLGTILGTCQVSDKMIYFVYKPSEHCI